MFRFDSRDVSLNLTIKGLSEAITTLKNKVNDLDYYDVFWLLEESEPIFGLAFIAFQNYINASISDFTYGLERKEKKEKYYNLEQKTNDTTKSKIELIIGLANYAKHKEEEGPPHKGTKETLDYFKINYDNENPLDESPIFQGLTLLNDNWDLFKIKDYVTDWRELLWSRND